MFGYFITILASIFWIFRLLVSIVYTTGDVFIVEPMNITFEIILLFITFICIIFIAKRRMSGAIVYLVAQCAYFGIDAYKNLESIIYAQPQTITYISLIVSIIGVIIPTLAVMNIGLSTGKKGSYKNKNTDWFYATTEHDRQLDERADKNQYKF